MVLFLIMVLLSFAQVLLREFFSTGFLWADTFLRHLVLWVGFLGAGLAVGSSSHFVIDITKKFLPEKAKRLSEIIIALFSLTVLALLFSAAYEFLKYDIETKAVLFSIGTFEVPAFWMNLILPLGFALLFAHFLLQAILYFSHPRSSR